MKYTHEELALLNQYMYIEGAEEKDTLKDNIIDMKKKLKDPNSKIRLGAELSRKEALDTLERIEKNPKLMHLKIMESYNNNNLGVILQDTSKDNINKESLLVSRGTGGDNDIWRDSFKGIIGELTPESLKYLQ